MSNDAQDPNFAHQGGHDSESYLLTRSRPRRKISQSPRDLMKDALIGEGPEPDLRDLRPATPLVITDEMKQDTLRRIKASARNTLVTIHPDGKRSYKHDIVNRGDGLVDTMTHGRRTDRGEGTVDSLRMLDKEGTVKVEGLSANRDSSGRFTKGGR